MQQHKNMFDNLNKMTALFNKASDQHNKDSYTCI